MSECVFYMYGVLFESCVCGVLLDVECGVGVWVMMNVVCVCVSDVLSEDEGDVGG